MADVEAPQIDTSAKKKFMFVNRKAPYGTIYALESLEVVLISRIPLRNRCTSRPCPQTRRPDSLPSE